MMPSYYGISPAAVRYDEDLCANAKLLYIEITALSNKEGYCWATNDYFAKLYKVSKVSVSKWISQLVKKGHIISHIIRDKNTKQVLERRLYIADSKLTPSKEKFNRGHKEKLKRGHEEKFKDNTTSVNTTSNIYMSEKIFLKDNEEIPNAPNETKLATENSRTNFVGEDMKKPPTVEEIEDLIIIHKLRTDANKFYDYYRTTNWRNSKGKLITKENVIFTLKTWDTNNFQSGTPKPSEKVPPKFSKEEQLKKQQLEDQKEQERQERLSKLDSEKMKKQLKEILSKTGMDSPSPRGTLMAEILGRSKNQK